MAIEQIIFYILAAITVGTAVMVVSAKNPVHSALFLVLSFFASAGIWAILEAEFLAVTLVLVYVGAVMVLFLFVVMMLDLNAEELRAGFAKYLPLGLLVAGLMVTVMLLVVAGYNGSDGQVLELVRHGVDHSNVKELGAVLYTDYVYPFEIASVILLVAIIAAISLTHRRRAGTKYQSPGKQVQAKRDDRVRLVKVASEKE